jgi:hypothetical protein
MHGAEKEPLIQRCLRYRKLQRKFPYRPGQAGRRASAAQVLANSIQDFSRCQQHFHAGATKVQQIREFVAEKLHAD